KRRCRLLPRSSLLPATFPLVCVGVQVTLRHMHAFPPVTARDRLAASGPDVGGWRPRRPPVRAALILGILGLAAVPRDARAEAAPPPELLASVAIGPASTLRNFAAYADAVKPGSGAIVNDAIVRQGLAQAVGASSLDGFDPASWSYLLVGSLDGTPSFALVSKARDATKLADGA